MGRLAKGLLILPVIIVVLAGTLAAVAETAWFAGLLARRAGGALDREISVDGALDIDWSLRPRLRLPPLTIANPDWTDIQPMARLDGAEVTLDLTALARGRIALGDLLLIGPRLNLLRAADGRSSWDSLTGDGSGGGPAVSLDTVRVRDGHLLLDDAAQALRLDLAIGTAPAASGAAERLQAAGRGSRRGAPFELDLQGGPLLALTDPDHSYPVAGWLRSQDTLLELDGSLRRPASPKSGAFRMTLRGPNPANLHDLLGLPLPDLPPYRLAGELRFADGVWTLRDFAGAVGDSDLAGDLTIRPGEPLAIEADLRSRRLDLDDIAPVFGAPPAAGGGETASPEQARQAQSQQQDDEVLPRREADRSRLQGVTAQLRFRGERVNAPRGIPLERVALTLRLTDGVLHADPLTLGVGGGRIESRVSYDTTRQPAQGTITAQARGVDLGDLLGDFGIPSGGFGTIRADLDTRFAGDNVKRAFGSADGSLLVYMTSGQVDAVLIALAGLDAGQALVAKLFGSGPTSIECAFMHMQAKEGVAAIERFLVATEKIDLRAGGSVNLGRETLDLALRGYPRDPTVGASDAPVRVEGRFADADISVLSDELLTRGAFAAVAALVAPPLAIIPFLNPGSGDEKEDVCAALTREAKDIEAGKQR